MYDKLTPMPSEYIYALDIGTRNVVGVIATMQDDKLKVIDYCTMSHPQRSMYDGQIHEIEAVAKIVRQVTDVLEQRNGYKITHTSIAAAGRALITKHVSISKELDPSLEITKEFLDVLEISAIQNSQAEVENRGESQEIPSARYFCIGYSVARYFIDDVEIKNPIDHRGSNIRLDMILTFLPQSVVDSLYKVIDKTGLYVKNITLEPIAAIKISIPEKFRLLNLALVDVGAGTSDIAITKEGHIFSYGMIDVAGDEITEALVKEYLVDFDVAEELKKEISNPEISSHSYVDILGFENVVEKSQVVEKLTPLLEEMAQKVVTGILQSNADNPPSAVFLIGGGCQFPNFKELIAQKLSLPQQRVAIKEISAYSEFVIGAEDIKGPENVTPFGIAIHSIKNEFNDFLQIQVNDTPVRLFNSKQLKVADALAMVGFAPRQLLPRKGSNLEFSLNREHIRIHGTYGEAAKIYINGSEAKLDSMLKNKDLVNIAPAINGIDAKKRLYEYLALEKFVFFEGEKIFLKYDITLNSKEFEGDKSYYIQNGDVITFKQIITLRDLLEYLQRDVRCLVNSVEVDENYVLKHSDVIMCYREDEKLQDSSEVMKEKKSKNQSSKKNNESHEKYEHDFIVNGKPIKIQSKEKSMIFVDIFNYIPFDEESVQKDHGRVVIKLNGNPAGYTDSIKSGDVIEITFEENDG